VHSKFIYFISLISIILLFFSCTKQQIKEEISNEKKLNSDINITEIDSLISIEDLNEIDLAKLYFKKGKLLSILQKDKAASENFEKALNLFKKQHNKELIAETYWHLGSEYAFLNEKVKATDYLLKALEFNKVLKQQKLEANIYGSLAHVHYLYKDFNQAAGYTIKAIEIQKKIKDTLSLSATYNNLAVIYKNMGNFNLALDNNKESLRLNTLLNDKSAIAKSYNNIGLVYEAFSDYKQAEKYYKKAILLNNSIKNFNSSPLQNLGALYLSGNKISPSKKSYLKALEIEKKTQNSSKLKKIYNILLKISLNEKDFKNSLIYQTKRDSLSFIQSKIDNEEKLQLTKNQYKLVAKETELKQQKQINKKDKIIFGTLALLLFSFAFFWMLSVKNKRLKNEKEKVMLEQRVLRSQMNPHFIFNALAAIQNSLLDNNPIKSASYLSKFAKLIRQNFDFINEKSILLKYEIDALINYMDTQKMRFADKFDYEINLHSDIDIHQIEIPPLLLQPFIENAIEHGFKNKKEKGKISITVSKQNKSICYEIKDNGKGIDQSKKDHKTHSLSVFKKRLQLLEKGDEKTFNIESSSKGTTIKFCLKQ